LIATDQFLANNRFPGRDTRVGVSTDIRVDLTALTGVLADLRRDVDQGLQPSTSGAKGELGDDARFGTSNASGEVHAGATDISFAASIAANNVVRHVKNALRLADTIEAAVVAYRLADSMARNTLAKVDPAIAAVEAPPATSTDTGSLTPAFVGPLPSVTLPIQALTSAAYCTNWGAYDTPRLSSMVRPEVSDAAWAQMQAFRKLGDALDEQHRRLIVLRQRLSSAWGSSQAGEEMLKAWDQHMASVASDATCAQITSVALNGILTVLADTKVKLQKQQETWDRVTTDFVPEAWDHKAQETNEASRKIMADAEAAIRDYRQMIKVPQQAKGIFRDQSESPGDTSGEVADKAAAGPAAGAPAPSSARAAEDRNKSASGNAQEGGGVAASGRSKIPPPVPGILPTEGPNLSGGPVQLPVSVSNPPSLLAVPPGVIPQAPNGGAYILPGAWPGAGRLLPMPASDAVPSSRLGPSSPISGQGGTGMYGFPAAGVGQADANRSNRQRMATEQWEIARGGPSVIGTAKPWYKIDEEEEGEDPVERLEQWIKIVGTPWDLNPDEGAS
jgi:hypothetical protein